ncbi:MAG: family 16 glycosylhydrolase [Flavobacteriaceae bacterium]|nr:family 16 glycosylhydrolase [Bacteroidia bacterium]MBT8288731.1 family 16 glycosylhydrolase [Bacteroidia bacterium]NNF73776.1 family 16 glycosylhydrolase [Flavobacteriaceae bacterium]NNK74293.1 family 16 glycosylhydrolase [Flavobacteriaceae bacterium]
MKNFIKIILPVFALLLILQGCQDDDQQFGDIIVPSNLTLSFEIVGQDIDNPNGDGSGLVNFTASADNAITFRYEFGDGTQGDVTPSGDITHRFNLTGVNSYTVTVIASGTGGVPTSTSVILDVFSAFDDEEAKTLLTGGAGSSKIWYLDASSSGHLGVGPSLLLDLIIYGSPTEFYYPSFYSATPFEKCGDPSSDCLCDDELTFSLGTDNQLTFQLNNNGQTFFNQAHQDIVGGPGGSDLCFDFDTSGVSNVSLAPTSVDWSLVPDPSFSSRGTVMNFSDDAFMGYYVSSSSYEIISLTENTLYVRTIDGNDPTLAWYHKYSTTNPLDETALNSIYNTLVWQDEFSVDGAPDPANWTYDIGTGSGGWGNGEEQYYTDDPSNVIIENGLLKITARAESFMGSEFTSSRLKSENLFEFSYGRVEIRAKLPTGGGTWPALWMLGANFDEVGWPTCGEIDIMEHVGNQQNTIFGTVHFPGNSGGNSIGGEIEIPDASDTFHNYTVEWKVNEIIWAVDNEIFFTFENDGSLPFNADFFLILNVAMGGNFGGDIDPAFTESSLEIDFVKVYQ